MKHDRSVVGGELSNRVHEDVQVDVVRGKTDRPPVKPIGAGGIKQLHAAAMVMVMDGDPMGSCSRRKTSTVTIVILRI